MPRTAQRPSEIIVFMKRSIRVNRKQTACRRPQKGQIPLPEPLTPTMNRPVSRQIGLRKDTPAVGVDAGRLLFSVRTWLSADNFNSLCTSCHALKSTSRRAASERTRSSAACRAEMVRKRNDADERGFPDG